MIVRADFHIHSGDDPYDRLPYSVYQAIDRASERGLNCMAVSDHCRRSWRQDYADYAAGKSVLLLPSIEARICKRDVIILNAEADAERLRTLDDLRDYRSPDRLTIAPHPFYPIDYAMSEILEQNTELFDALEISSCYWRWFNSYN